MGVAVTSEGTDAGQAAPMEEQVVRRTDQHPDSYLMDGGFATREDITTLEQRAVTVYAPVRLPRNRPEQERYQPRYEDGPEVITWRQRMSTEEAKAVYRPKGLYGRMDQCSGTSSRSVPIQRTRACQSHQRYAACRRSPQPPALGGVVGVSRHSGEPQSPGGDIARKVAKALSQCRLPQRIPNSLKLANAFSSTTIALTTKGTSKHSLR